GPPPRSATTIPGWPARPARGRSSSTAGNRARRHWRAASRAIRRQRSAAVAARASSGRATDRSATTGTMRSTPSSVSFWTTSSGLSPLVRAKATARRGASSGSRSGGPTASRWTAAPPTGAVRHGHGLTGPQAQDAAEVVAVVAGDVEPVDELGGRLHEDVGGGSDVGRPTLRGTLPGPRGHELLEGALDAGEEALLAGGDLLAPQLGQPADELRLLGRELLGHHDLDAD